MNVSTEQISHYHWNDYTRMLVLSVFYINYNYAKKAVKRMENSIQGLEVVKYFPFIPPWHYKDVIRNLDKL